MSVVGSRVRRVLLVAVVVLALALAGWRLAAESAAVRAAASRLSVGWVSLAALACLASLAVRLQAWRGTMAALGVRLPLRPAARVFFVGQLGKYVPGSVWPALVQAELAAPYGWSRATVGTASVLALGLGLPGGLLVGSLAAPALLSGGAAGYLVVFLALPLALLALWPPVLNRGLAWVLRRLRQPPPGRLAGRTVAQVAGLSALADVLLGLHAAALAYDLGATGARLIPVAVGAYVLALVAGLLAVPVPAGAGVRELVLVAALSPVLPVADALVLAVVSRVLLTLADLLVAGLGVLSAGRSARVASSSGAR